MKNTPLLLLLTLVFSLLFAPITHAAAYIKFDGIDGEVKTNEKTDTSTSSASYKREGANAYELKNVQVTSVVEEKPKNSTSDTSYKREDANAYELKNVQVTSVVIEEEIGVPPEPKLNPPKPDNKEDESDGKASKNNNDDNHVVSDDSRKDPGEDKQVSDGESNKKDTSSESFSLNFEEIKVTLTEGLSKSRAGKAGGEAPTSSAAYVKFDGADGESQCKDLEGDPESASFRGCVPTDPCTVEGETYKVQGQNFRCQDGKLIGPLGGDGVFKDSNSIDTLPTPSDQDKRPIWRDEDELIINSNTGDKGSVIIDDNHFKEIVDKVVDDWQKASEDVANMTKTERKEMRILLRQRNIDVIGGLSYIDAQTGKASDLTGENASDNNTGYFIVENTEAPTNNAAFMKLGDIKGEVVEAPTNSSAYIKLGDVTANRNTPQINNIVCASFAGLKDTPKSKTSEKIKEACAQISLPTAPTADKSSSTNDSQIDNEIDAINEAASSSQTYEEKVTAIQQAYQTVASVPNGTIWSTAHAKSLAPWVEYRDSPIIAEAEALYNQQTESQQLILDITRDEAHTTYLEAIAPFIEMREIGEITMEEWLEAIMPFHEVWDASKNLAAEVYISTTVVQRTLYEQTVQPVEEEYDRAITEIEEERDSLMQQARDARDAALAALEEN